MSEKKNQEAERGCKSKRNKLKTGGGTISN